MVDAHERVYRHFRVYHICVCVGSALLVFTMMGNARASYNGTGNMVQFPTLSVNNINSLNLGRQ